MHGHHPRALVASLLLAALVSGAASAQDDCFSAIPVGAGLVAGSTNGLVTNTVAPCGTLQKDLWLQYVPSCSGTAFASLCAPGSASFDAMLAAFDGIGGCLNLVLLACNDNTCGTAPSISFPVTAGMPYYLALGSTTGATGSFTLSIACSSVVPHDECAGAIQVGTGITSGSNFNATNSPQSGTCGNVGSDVWYAWTATCTGVGEATFCQPGTATFDTVLAVFDGSTPCGTLAEIACNDDTCVLRSKATFPVVAGNLYYVSVGGFAGAQGTFALSMACHAAPTNDACAGATPLSAGANGPFSNQWAASGTPAPTSCPAGTADVWFVFTPPCAGTYRIDTCGTGYDTVLSAFQSCAPGSVALACNDDDPAGGGCGPGSAIHVGLAAGAPCLVRVAGAVPAAGSFFVTVTPVFLLGYASPAGAGSIAYSITGGLPNGIYLNVATFNQGSFPNGAFYGVDVTLQDLLQLIAAGYPFLGTLDACGASVFSYVLDPALSGLTVYSVAVATDATATLGPFSTPPVAYTIP
jgi:hypothetical protein